MNTSPTTEELLYPAYSLEDLEAELDHWNRIYKRRCKSPTTPRTEREELERKVKRLREAIKQRVEADNT